MAADYQFLKYLGFNLISYNQFFLLSQLSRLNLFQFCVVV
nr:MAG TPA: hypothetical protein [Bacteriophage sp.]